MSLKIQSIDAEKFRDSVFFRLRICRPGIRAKVKDMAKLEQYLQELHASNGSEESESSTPAVSLPASFKVAKANDTVKVTKRLLLPRKATKDDPSPDAYENAVSFMSGVKETICGRFGRALPSRIDEGLFVLAKWRQCSCNGAGCDRCNGSEYGPGKIDQASEINEELHAAVNRLKSEFIPAIMADYAESKERAATTPVKQGGLGPLYREADYISESDFCAAFGLEWLFLALGIPEELPAALRAEAAEKMEAQMTQAANEVKEALRAAFQELIAHATSKLSVGIGEKGATFRDSLIGNIAQFCDVFSARNLMNDTELEALVLQARNVLVGVAPDKLRKYENVRQEVKEGFAAIQAQLDTMLVAGKGRKFDLED